MSDRAAQRRDFVVRAGWGDADERLLAGDASFRKYFRLTRSNGTATSTAVVMDAPAPQEDVRPFVRIGRHLLSMELSAPEIRAVDEANGFLLLEDLGDDTFARVLANGGDEAELYARATDVLATVYAAPEHGLLPDLGAYEGGALIEAAMLLPDWYLPEASGHTPAAEIIQGYIAAWRACLANLPPGAGTLLLRDFHKDNLLWLPQRPGVRACGLLDFQDAQRGHPSYDLVSLIEDARRDVSPAVQSACLARYLATTGLPDKDFRTGYALMAAQRHARIIGLFVRLLRRDGKPEYLPHLPRVWRMFERALAHPALEPLRVWVDLHLPPPLRRIGSLIDTAMILAAGRGERMRPLTDSTPKPMLPVAGRSMLDRSMDRLTAHGVRTIVVNVHHLGEQIAAHLDGCARVVREDRLLETGGSVKNALPLLGVGPYFILNGDGLWRDGSQPMLSRMETAWDPVRMDALLLLHPIDKAIGREAKDRGDYFREADGRARHRGNETSAPYMFASVSICDSRLLRDSPDGPFSLLKLWTRAEAEGRLFGIVHDGDWFHVGTRQALADAEALLR